MIKRIIIKKLFGVYDYDINFSNEQNLTVITGPNGYGKTTILNIIKNLYELNFWYFYFRIFEFISIEYSNEVITIRKLIKDASSGEDYNNLNLDVEFTLNGSKDSLLLDEGYIKSSVFFLKKQITNSFVDDNSFNDEELFNKLYDINKDNLLKNKANSLIMFLKGQPKHLSISESRVVSVDEAKFLNSTLFTPDISNVIESEVKNISNELVGYYSNVNNKYAAVAHIIDSTFISRFLDLEINKNVYSKTQCEAEIENINHKVSLYKKFDLYSNNDQDIYNLKIDNNNSDEIAKVLTVHINNLKEKLFVYEGFYEKLKLFQSFIEDLGLSNKSVHFDKAKGLILKNTNGNIIPLDKLSSGEQNIIILYFKIIFSVKKDSVILIDEPENSLHVAWLSNMLDDYLSLAEKLKCQIIIASHSPAFINGKWDLTADLYEIDSNRV